MDSITTRVSPKILVIIAVGFLLFIIALFALLSQFSAQQSSSQSEDVTESTDTRDDVVTRPGLNRDDSNPDSETEETSIRLDRGETPPEPDVIAVVGEEYLYSEDLNTELSYTRGTVTSSKEDDILEKMIRDSVILQAAEEEGVIQLDESIFNARDKDYAKRTQTVRKIEDAINVQTVAIEGEVVTIWFNNVVPGPAGYEAGKQIAFEKISALHEQVQSGRLTMEQAGERIRQDEEIAQADPSWKANTYHAFSAQSDDRITADPTVSEQIHSLGEGDVSEVFTGQGQDAKTGEMIPSFYSFAQVSEKQTDSVGGFDEWLSDKLTDYETTIY